MLEIKTTKKYIRSLIITRQRNSHKGDYGHVLVIAGSIGMDGAGVLASGGALRSGAGLVTLATPASQQPIAAKKARPEVMTLALDETKQKTVSSKAFRKIAEFIKKRKITAVVIGPGIGVNNETCNLVRKILANISLPVVLDAGGLGCIGKAGRKDFQIRDLIKAKSAVIVTPHVGELSNLTNITAAEINRDRSHIAKRFAKENKVVCVLKGDKTVVTDGDKVFINTTGNPGMATAGSGDVLSGMIAGFIKQVKGPAVLNSSLTGVFLHGLAGNIAKKQKTELGLIAGDLIENIPLAEKR